MPFPVVFSLFVGLFAFVECQRPLEGVTVSEIFPLPPAPNISRECGHENEMLRKEIESLKRKLEIVREIEDESDSNESREPARRNRRRRGVKCDAGTLAAWACAPQCVFKLKGLCGLSLKTICHC